MLEGIKIIASDMSFLFHGFGLVLAVVLLGFFTFQLVFPLILRVYWTILVCIAKKKYPNNPELRAYWLWAKGVGR